MQFETPGRQRFCRPRFDEGGKRIEHDCDVGVAVGFGRLASCPRQAWHILASGTADRLEQPTVGLGDGAGAFAIAGCR